MIPLLDSSVLIAALLPKEHYHHECVSELLRPQAHLYTHALNEVFSTLTGGRLGYQIAANEVTKLIRRQILPRVSVVTLSGDEIMDAQEDAERCGVRGGAIYDFMHFTAAKKIRADAIVTLNRTDFESISRHGGPEALLPR